MKSFGLCFWLFFDHIYHRDLHPSLLGVLVVFLVFGCLSVGFFSVFWGFFLPTHVEKVI